MQYEAKLWGSQGGQNLDETGSLSRNCTKAAWPTAAGPTWSNSRPLRGGHGRWTQSVHVKSPCPPERH